MNGTSARGAVCNATGHAAAAARSFALLIAKACTILVPLHCILLGICRRICMACGLVHVRL
jgi:hypothetical protein